MDPLTVSVSSDGHVSITPNDGNVLVTKLGKTTIELKLGSGTTGWIFSGSRIVPQEGATGQTFRQEVVNDKIEIFDTVTSSQKEEYQYTIWLANPETGKTTRKDPQIINDPG